MIARGHEIDLNADLGEGCPWDEALLERVTSASISCGAHAGNSQTIRATIRAAESRNVTIGAHPGYPDREHFGRKDLHLSSDAVRDLVVEQLHTLDVLARELGGRLQFLKPHGALYNQAQRDESTARGIVEALDRFASLPGMAVVGQPKSVLSRELAALSPSNGRAFRYVPEGFIDRRYDSEGYLVPRSEPGAVLDDPAEIRAQIIRLVEQGIETLCVHGDNPDSLCLADLAIETLKPFGVVFRSFA